MRLIKTDIPDLLILESNPNHDGRGYFHRLFDAAVFESADIDFIPRQSGISHNLRAGTLRGLHYQTGRSSQAKLVRCLRGKLFDVAVDLRPASITYRRWFGIELSENDHRALFVPAGFAHGFLTIQDRTDILYELSNAENVNEAAGIRWNDPIFGIRWPGTPVVINERDTNYPDFAARK
ncbi:MAG: dTDP-4-dehydrorhamnose 3,5-epimerase [Afipia sp.]